MPLTPLVSVLTPCYNGSNHLKYFLESLLRQSYSHVQLIFINDGSTDNTAEVFNHFKNKFIEKGWSVKYFYQNHAGQAAALNRGLKEITGKYFIYPDSDDILYPNHIEEKVDYMEKHPDIAMAFCILDVVRENDLNNIIRNDYRKPKVPDNLALDLINFENILWPPVGNIIRSKNLFHLIPNREIFAGLGGQNFQIQFPLASHFKYGYINKPLAKYVLRGDSYSHSAPQDPDRLKKFMNIWINTIYQETDKTKREFYLAKALNCFHNKLLESKKRHVQSKKIYLFSRIPLVSIKIKPESKLFKILGIPVFKIITK